MNLNCCLKQPVIAADPTQLTTVKKDRRNTCARIPQAFCLRVFLLYFLFRSCVLFILFLATSSTFPNAGVIALLSIGFASIIINSQIVFHMQINSTSTWRFYRGCSHVTGTRLNLNKPSAMDDDGERLPNGVVISHNNL